MVDSTKDTTPIADAKADAEQAAAGTSTLTSPTVHDYKSRTDHDVTSAEHDMDQGEGESQQQNVAAQGNVSGAQTVAGLGTHMETTLRNMLGAENSRDALKMLGLFVLAGQATNMLAIGAEVAMGVQQGRRHDGMAACHSYGAPLRKES